jgi:hypothetical protein
MLPKHVAETLDGVPIHELKQGLKEYLKERESRLLGDKVLICTNEGSNTCPCELSDICGYKPNGKRERA